MGTKLETDIEGDARDQHRGEPTVPVLRDSARGQTRSKNPEKSLCRLFRVKNPGDTSGFFKPRPAERSAESIKKP